MADIQRDVLEVDVLFVGAGPACLAGALRLAQLLEEKEKAGDRGAADFTVALIEKAAEPGFHSCSGAILDPRALKELLPDYRALGCPIEGDVFHDEVWYLHEQTRTRLPFTPKPLDNEGLHVVSLGRLTRWLWDLCEKTGKVNLFPATAGSELLWDGDKVVGVRTGDKGLDKDGNPKGNFEPGIDIRAKVTILGEGVRGSLAKTAIAKLRLDKDRHAQVYGIGIKELWQLPPGTVKPGRVIHTMGWPLRDETYGGGFIYTMSDDLVDIGMVIGLDYANPNLEPHAEFQRMKTHPEVAKLLEGGKMVQYGAKALPEGGWWSIPRVWADGLLLCGDTASFLNPMRLKGIHTAMKTGMLAAETIYEALVADDFSKDFLRRYKQKVDASWVKAALYPNRNFHHCFEHDLISGSVLAGIQYLMPVGGPFETEEDHERTQDRMLFYKDGQEPAEFDAPLKYNPETAPDKLTDAYLSGTKHEEKQPSHLRLSDPNQCYSCWERYRSPCTRFCPVKVYEMPEDVDARVKAHLRGPHGQGILSDDASHAELQRTSPNPVVLRPDGDGVVEFTGDAVPGQQHEGQLLHINFTNCIHCKTCDIKCPHLNLEWTPPEGEGGPAYRLC